MLSNREKAISVIQGMILVGSKERTPTSHSLTIAYDLVKRLELDIGFEEFGKISMDLSLIHI